MAAAAAVDGDDDILFLLCGGGVLKLAPTYRLEDTEERERERETEEGQRIDFRTQQK